ncbi:MAG: EF-P beta-lysylation protein EpmB [Cycloclasticus sp. symbiont of Poecilosclerida sp. M]|nr:MAG: EF-P beta-lysylation protein EpmB [Cycloclasticus sp. symbiont of Poecilosclerida sp. M]
MLCMELVAKSYTPQTWQQELANAFTQLDDLLSFLDLEIDDLANHYKANHDFPLLVTLSYAKCIKKSDLNDPLLRQVLPTPGEIKNGSAYSVDPVGDEQASVLPGLIHKYHGRVLLVTTGACAIHCRYCFRRSFPYSENSALRSQFTDIVAYLNKNPDISEVIFSGGDPLTLSDQRLKSYFEQLANIEHIKRIRIHSRLPIVLPSRITDELVSLLKAVRQQLIIVVHANHANELSIDVCRAINKLSEATPHLFNQTVLLKGVNDSAETLVELSHKLFDYKVTPYYLHVLDRVKGAQHFDLEIDRINILYEQVQSALPGYLVPKLVKEESGRRHKTLLTPAYSLTYSLATPCGT